MRSSRLPGCRKTLFHFSLIFYLIFEKFKEGGFTVAIFWFIFQFIFDVLWLQKRIKNGSKVAPVNAPNDNFILAYGFGRRPHYLLFTLSVGLTIAPTGYALSMRWPTFGDFHGQHFHSGHAHQLISPLIQRCGVSSHPFWRLLLSDKP